MKMDKPRTAVARRPLAELEQHRGFVDRHIGTTDAEQAEMLKVLGYASRSALIDAAVPPAIRLHEPLALSAAKAEEEALDELKTMARKNRVLKSYIGQGYYGTLTPGVILRNLLENPAWYTAYTPYQPEISQGRLEALVNFQTMVCDLTGLAIANASMLDEATAAAEAMTLARRVGKSASNAIWVADDVLPQTIDVVRTRAQPLGLSVVVSSSEMPTCDASIWRRLAPCLTAAACNSLLRSPVATVSVSKKVAFTSAKPSCRRPAARTPVKRWIRAAIVASPGGP